jgi:hypothetical protein
MLSPKILTNQNCSRGFIINVCLRKEAALGRLPKDTGRIYCGSCSEFKVATAKVTRGRHPLLLLMKMFTSLSETSFRSGFACITGRVT